MPVNAPRIVQFPTNRVQLDQARSRHPQAERRPWLRVVILICTVAYLFWAGSQLIRQELRMRQLQKNYEQLLAVQEELQATNQSIERQIESLSSDSAYLEQLARQMGMVKPNDRVYLPVDSTP